MTFTTKAIKLTTFLLLTATTHAVTLKRDSYSSETALGQLDETATQTTTPCLCFRYEDSKTPDADGTFSTIEIGGTIQAHENHKCEDEADNKVVEVTNQSCLYKLWMCACWSS